MRWVLLALLGLAVTACERKAPGPVACRSFAYRALGYPAPEEAAGEVELPPRAQADVDHLTEQCLTTPYDYELIECVQRTRFVRGCTQQFQLRKRAR